jgi:transposase-like protein
MDPYHTFLELPLCPKCDQTMILARTGPRLGGVSRLDTFECKACSVVFTEVVTGHAPIPERVIALHQEPYRGLQ